MLLGGLKKNCCDLLLEGSPIAAGKEAMKESLSPAKKYPSKVCPSIRHRLWHRRGAVLIPMKNVKKECVRECFLCSRKESMKNLAWKRNGASNR